MGTATFTVVDGNPFASPPKGRAEPAKSGGQRMTVVQGNPFTAKPPGAVEDAGRALLAGVTQGVDGFTGAFGDLRDLPGALVEWSGDKVKKGLGADMRKFSEQVAYGGPLGEVVRNAQRILVSGSLQKMGVDPNLAESLGSMAPGMAPGVMATPSGAQIRAVRTQLAGPDYEPKTKTGEFARTLGQFAPAALAPASAVERVAVVAAPALLSEGAGQALKGTKYETAGRVGGALLGGGPAAAVSTRSKALAKILAKDLENVTPEQLAAARALQESAPFPITAPEAVDQVTGSASTIGTRQRIVEGTSQGRTRYAAALADRPQRVRDATLETLDLIAPKTADPVALGLKSQDAASSAINRTRQDINAQASPLYDALAEQTMAPTHYAELTENAAYKAALQAFRGDPVLSAQYKKLPDSNLAVVNEVVKQLDALKDAATPGVTNPTGNATKAALYAEARQMADRAAGLVSDEWRQARDIVREGRAATLNPMKAGPTGRIAESPDVKAQTAALYPSAPIEGATVPAAVAINATGPELAAALTRQHLANNLNEATQNLQGGANQYGGAKFAAQTWGNPEQRAVLEQGIGMASPEALPQWKALALALEATGKRQPPGSQTAMNIEDLKNLGEAGAAGAIGGVVNSAPWSSRGIAEALRRYQLGSNADQLAKLYLGEPGTFEAEALRAIQRAPNSDLATRALLLGQGTRQQLEQAPAY